MLSVVLHHSENREGGPGLRLFGTRSLDGGRTWSRLHPIDDPSRQSHDGYQLVHRRPDGRERIFVFYGWNRGAHPADKELSRTDMQLEEGYWFRFSDDGARTWSQDRHLVPVRRTAIDRDNPWQGSVMGMFLCDKPSIIGGAVWMAFQKTADGGGETPGSEVFFLRSPDLLDCEDPADARWETLPAGERGLQAASGALRLGEEPHVLAIGDDPDHLLAMWRTEVGRIACATSEDGGSCWEASDWLRYDAPVRERPLRNPRGAITPLRLPTRSPQGNAEYALLFYNNGHTERAGYTGRRILWLTLGRATPAGSIRWHQPEIVLYWDGTSFEDRPDWNDEWAIVDGPGYADFLAQDNGQLSFVESNKLAVRYHHVDDRLLAALRAQPDLAGLPDDPPCFDSQRATPEGRTPGLRYRGPVLPDLRSGRGFSICLRLRFERADEIHDSKETLVSALSTVTAALGEEATDATITKGWEILRHADGTCELRLHDGYSAPFVMRSSPSAPVDTSDGNSHWLTFTCDGGPGVASVVVDEWLNDGGEEAPRGWLMLPPTLGEIAGAEILVPERARGQLERLLVFDRSLLTSEAIAISR